jgi:PAS domain S-box-containing protein
MSQSESIGRPEALTQLERTVRENLKAPPPDLQLPRYPELADRLLGVLELTRGWISETDSGGSLTYVSPMVEEVLGFTPEECLSTSGYVFHPDDLPKIIVAGGSVRQTGIPAVNEMRMRHRRGHWVWLENTLMGWTDAHGDYFTLIFSRDITDIKRAEAGQRESEARYDAIERMSTDLITEMDREGRYTYVDPACETILGYTVDEVLSLEAWSLLHLEDRDRVIAQLEAQFIEPALPPGASPEEHVRRDPQLVEARFQHKDGRWLWFEILGVTYPRTDGQIRHLAVNRDVTERVLAEHARREYEERLQRSQKLESLGILAGGIAHDFNNLLTPIMGAAGLGLIELPEDSPLRARFDTIRLAAKRAAALTNQMLAYAGQQPLRVERLDLTSLIEEMRELAISSVAGKTEIVLELQPELPYVEGEAAQLSQLMMNLISNAGEALAEGTGRLTIRTGVVSIDEQPSDVLFSETMPLGEHVYFEVADTGCGMDPETLDKIFDPFFTTKFTGRGLGLAAVAGIVRGHAGGIKVESEPGVGTCFRVMFPATDRPSVQTETSQATQQDFDLSGTALVIDDDDGVRELAEEVLLRAGMHVLTAADGREGVKLFERHASEIRVVLLDRTMPSLSGADTFEAIQAIRPDAKIVLVSGYSEERVTAELSGRGLVDRSLAGFLKKPFLPDALLSRIQEVLRPGG